MLEAAIVCLAMNIYHEARGESIEGQYAVAQVTMNRVEDRRYPDNTCDVVYQDYQFSWTHDNITDDMNDNTAKQTAMSIATDVINNGVNNEEVGNATHYHTTAVSPKWSKHPRVEKYSTIGNHIFYYEHP